MAMNVQAEIRDLKRRVGALEGSFGFLTQQVKGAYKDLLAFEAKTEQTFDKIDGRFAAVDGRFDQVDSRFGRVETVVRKLREDMPGIVGDAMRAVLRGRKRQAAQDVIPVVTSSPDEAQRNPG